MDFLCFSVLCLLCLCTHLFKCALWSPAGKGLTSWFSFVVSNCEFVNFSLVFWVRCDTSLHRFMIFAPLLTLWHAIISRKNKGICTGYLSSIKVPIKQDLLLILDLVRQQNFLNC